MKQIITPVVGACLFAASLLLAGCGEKKVDGEAKPAAEATSVAADKATGADAPAVAVGGDQPMADKLDVHPGKILHDSNCISCHDSSVYTRAERKIMDFTQLGAQVRRCDANLGTSLFDEELANITDYLNQAYYKYDK